MKKFLLSTILAIGMIFAFQYAFSQTQPCGLPPCAACSFECGPNFGPGSDQYDCAQCAFCINDNPTCQGIPINSGIIYLLVVGVGLGIKKIKGVSRIERE